MEEVVIGRPEVWERERDPLLLQEIVTSPVVICKNEQSCCRMRFPVYISKSLVR